MHPRIALQGGDRVAEVEEQRADDDEVERPCSAGSRASDRAMDPVDGRAERGVGRFEGARAGLDLGRGIPADRRGVREVVGGGVVDVERGPTSAAPRRSISNA